jgi:anti-sigma factor ChrR (cupin superfamily)
MEDFSPVKPSTPGIPPIPDVRYHVEASWFEAGDTGWRSPGPGLRLRDLFDDGEGYRVVLARLDPGAEVPGNGHPAAEHIFVLAGKIRDMEGEYGAGTYLMNPGGVSRRLWTHGGCLALIHWVGLTPFHAAATDSGSSGAAGRKDES